MTSVIFCYNYYQQNIISFCRKNISQHRALPDAVLCHTIGSLKLGLIPFNVCRQPQLTYYNLFYM